MTAITDLETPAVTVDLDIMEDNIRRVQAHLARHGHRQPPAHQDPQDPRDRQDADGGGRHRHHLPEARRGRGLRRRRGRRRHPAHLQHPRRGQDRAADGAGPARVKRLAVVLDNEVVARGLSEAAARHGLDIRFLVECDTGFGRNGVQTPGGRARPGARGDEAAAACSFEGLMTFPNREPEHARVLRARARSCSGAGIPVPVVSGGGTPALVTLRRLPDADRAPRRHLRLQRRDDGAAGAATWDNCAMRVRATVVSRPTDDRAVLDAGTKVLTSDQYYVEGLRPRHGVSRRRWWPLSPRSTAMVDLSGVRASGPRSARSSTWSPTTAAWSATWWTRSTACGDDAVEVVWPVAARGRVQ